jgi:hypothetical protein
MDLASEKAFDAASLVSLFHTPFRIFVLDFEVCFFGTAMIKKALKKFIVCSLSIHAGRHEKMGI